MAAALSVVLCVKAHAFEPAVNYMVQCMGCHTPDGSGEPGHVPSVRNTLIPFANDAAGRRFLVQVPGSAQSRLTDAELAQVLNWMIANLTESPKPVRFRQYTAEEVASYRGTRLVAVAEARARLVAQIGGAR